MRTCRTIEDVIHVGAGEAFGALKADDARRQPHSYQPGIRALTGSGGITKGGKMKVSNPKELFVLLLSDLWQGAERANQFFQELVPFVQDREIQEALEARVFLSDKIIETLSASFKLIGEKPVLLNGRMLEMFFENFREQLGEIQSVDAR